jgi:PAS domain S-box-containing protein
MASFQNVGPFLQRLLELLAVLGTDCVLKQVNPLWKDALGWSEADMLERPLAEFIYKDDLLLLTQELEKARIAATAVHFSCRVHCKNGTYKWLQWSVLYQDECFYIAAHDITQQKLKEVFFDDVQKAAGIGSWRFQVGHSQVLWSDEVYRILETPLDAAIDCEGALQYYPPEARSRIRESLAECVQFGKPFDLELPCATAKGKKLWVRTTGQARFNSEGRVEEVHGMLQDISIQKTQTLEIERLYSRLTTILETTRDLVWEASYPEHSLVYLSAAQTEDIYGRPAAEFLSDPELWLKVIHPDDQAMAQQKEQRIIEQRQPLELTYRIIHADGSIRWIKDRSMPLFNKDGEVTGFQGMASDVTKEKEEEEYLAKFKEIVELAQEGIWEIDADGNTIYVNRCMANMLETTPEDMLGKSMYEYMKLEEMPEARRNLEIRRKGIREIHEFKFLTAKGKPLWTSISSRPRLDKNGTMISAVGMIMDISSLKSREKELLEANALLERERSNLSAVVASLDDHVFKIDEDGLIHNVWTRDKSQLIYPIENIMGRAIRELFPADLVNRIMATLDRALETGQMQSIELNGKPYADQWFRARFNPHRNVSEQGRRLLTCVVEDISERIQFVEKIARSEELYRLIVQTSNDGIWDWDLTSDVISYSERWKSMLGYQGDELQATKETYFDLIHPDDRPIVKQNLRDHFESGKPYFHVTRCRHKDGSWRFILARGSSIRDASGRPVRMVGTHTDITESRQRELQTELAMDQLRAFIANMPTAVAMFDHEMHYISHSNQWLLEYGLKESSLIGKSHYEIFPEINDEWKRIHQQCLVGQVMRGERYRFQRLDGSQQWLRWDIRPWYQEDSIGGIIIFTQDITQEVEAQERFRQEKEKVEAIAHNTPVMFCIYGEKDGSIEWVNPYWEKTLGWRLEDMQGRDMNSELYLDSEQREKSKNISTSNPGKWSDFKTLTRRGDYIYTSWATIRLSGGRALGIGLDVSDRINDKRRIEQSEGELRALIEASPDHIVRIDRDLKIRYINHSNVAFQNAHLIGRCILDYIPEHHHALVIDQMNKAIVDHEIGSFEVEVVAPNQKVFWFHARIVPLLFQNNEVRELMLVAQDVTQQHDSNERIRTLASLIDASQDIFGYTDPQLKPIYFNESTKQRFGWTMDVPSIADFVPADVMQKYVDEVLPSVTSTGRQWEGEAEIIDKHNGQRVPIWQRIFCLKDNETGKVLYYATVATDLRQQKADEIRLIQASKMATLGEMAGGVAHEINNPLTVIQGSARKIRRELEKKNLDLPEVAGTIATIEKTTTRIAHIIKGLRAYARDDSQEEMSTVRVIDIINDTLGFCAERIRHHGIELSIGQIPPALQIECRPVQIAQILLNLLSNSFDAVEALPEKWIHLKVAELPDAIEFLVSDSGPGIPDQLAHKIMNPFFTTKSVGKGTGLGLSIARGLAQSHGGVLYYDRTSTHTKFVLQLPKTQQNSIQALL